MTLKVEWNLSNINLFLWKSRNPGIQKGKPRNSVDYGRTYVPRYVRTPRQLSCVIPRPSIDAIMKIQKSRNPKRDHFAIRSPGFPGNPGKRIAKTDPAAAPALTE